MKTPKFSIIIPAHNSERYIENALESVEMQTFRDFELIVVCDSCTDMTEVFAKSYGAITDKVEYGCDGPTRSRGLDLASGEWVLFIDDDDWWVRPDMLEVLSDYIDVVEKAGKQFDIVAFSFEWPNYTAIGTPTGNNGNYWPAVWNKCWRRNFIGDTRFPDVAMESDFEFWKEMASKQPRVLNFPVVFYHYNYGRVGSQTEQHSHSE